MTNRVLFFSNDLTNRLQYVVQLVLVDLLGLDVIFTKSHDLLSETELPKINFSTSSIATDEWHITPHTLLFENTIKEYNFSEKAFNQLDIFSKVFYLVTRYEEYNATPSVFDHHNRFPASASLAKKLNFLHKPIINEWVINFKNELRLKYPNLIFEKISKYTFQPTYDIDQAWAFKNKGIVRNIGGFLREILRGGFLTGLGRLGVMAGISNDPEYTFGYMEKLNKTYNLKPIHFWLLGDYGAFDKNIDWQNRAFQHLIRHIAKRYAVGIHPSYQSNEDKIILKKEVDRLETIIKNPDANDSIYGNRLSRQHFLKLRFPDTYRSLIEVGITDDYSMGYADDMGFRASIATPYKWYDLENEQMTHLTIHPFAVMEVTLQQYLALPPDQAFDAVKPLIDSVKAVNGTFTTLWHNSTLSDKGEWKGWRTVYENIIDYAKC
jgi:hypothetical protein